MRRLAAGRTPVMAACAIHYWVKENILIGQHGAQRCTGLMHLLPFCQFGTDPGTEMHADTWGFSELPVDLHKYVGTPFPILLLKVATLRLL